MIAVGKDLVLQRQVGAARIDQVDAGQMALSRDFLGAQVLFHRQRKIAAAFYRGVVADHHAVEPLDPPDPGDDAGGGRRAIIHAVGGCGADFQERAAGVEQVRHPFARGHLATLALAVAGGLATPLGRGLRGVGNLGQCIQMALAIGLEDLRTRRDFRSQFHCIPLP